MMGLVLGLFTSEKAAVPVGNLIYLPLSFAGGLWRPPSILPESLKGISPYLPTRYYGEILWAFVADKKIPNDQYIGLGMYMIIFTFLAMWGIRRERKRG